MLKTLSRTAAAVALTASIGFSTTPAMADGMADAYQDVLPGANAAIRNMMDLAAQRRREAAAQKNALVGDTVAQAPPVSQNPAPTQQLGLPTGPIYSLDFSMANPYGNIGNYGRGWLMGGMDATLGYGFSPTFQVQASLFQLQHWPYGFNSGKVPVYLQGFRNPVGCADLSGNNGCGPGTGRNINVRTKDTFGVFNLTKLVLLGGFLPVAISPIYVARGGNVGFAPDFSDKVPFSYNPPDGPFIPDLATRTAQYYSVALTLPFLKTPRMFGTFTLAPQWIVHTAGINSTNTMQMPQILYLEYSATKTTTIWAEPQSARDYLPTDPYPEHLIAYFLGVSQRVSKYGFFQAVLNSGQPTNLGPLGATSIKCLNVQQAINSTCGLAIGGLKATQIQLQFGIGSPQHIPL